MPLTLDSGIGVGLGFASTLLQAHLGIGLVLLALGSAVHSIPALREQLDGAPWEAGLRAAAAAAGPAPLLAVFALVQAVGAPPDLLAWAGLLASTGAVLLGALHAALCPACGLEAPAVHASTGRVLVAPSAEKERTAARFASASRALSSLRACGAALLVLSSLPAGVQLLSASALIRLALAFHALDAGAHALLLGRGGSAIAGMHGGAGSAMAAVPLIGSLALMDYMVYGPGSALLALVQPVLYCSLAALVQLGLAMTAGASLNGSTGELEQPHVKRVGHLTSLGLNVAMGFGVARILAGVISISASTAGISVQWGEPLFATASLLAALLFAVDAARTLAGASTTTPAAGTTHVNGSSRPETPSTMDRVEATAMPAHSLALALLASHAGLLEVLGPDGSLPSALPPLAYGLILAAVALLCQLLLALAPAGPEAGVPHAQQAALLLLQGGLALGLVGLGVRLWLPLAAVVVPGTLLLLPAEAREGLRGVLGACGGVAGGTAEYLASCTQAYVKQRQYAKEVLHAQRADAMAAEVERELARKAPADAKGARPSLKGPAAKAPPSGEAKAGKAKRSGAGRLR